MKCNNRREIIAAILAINITLSNILGVSAAPLNNTNPIEKYAKTYEETVKYPYAEFYLTHEQLQTIIEEANMHYFNADFESIIIDNENGILSQIKNNSNVVNQEAYTSVFKSKEALFFNTIVKKIINGIIEKNTNDKNEDLKKLKDLKIVYSKFKQESLFTDQYTFGCYYSQKNNAIIINKEMVMVQAEATNETYEDLIEKYLYHLINHLRQVPIEPNTSNKLDYTKKYHSILTEAAASKEPVVLNKTDKKSDSYYFDRYDSAILLMALLNKENTPESYYNAIFDEDTTKIFEIFNLNNYKNMCDFYNILYSCDALCKNNFFTDYYNTLYKDDNPAIMTEEIGYNYALDIYNTYTKDLITKSDTISLKENLTMYYIALNTLAISMNLDKKIYTQNDRYVISSLYFGHLNYLEFIKEYYKINDEDLKNITNNEIPLILENIIKNLTKKTITNDKYNEFSSKIINDYPMLKCIIIGDIDKILYQKIFNTYDSKLIKSH